MARAGSKSLHCRLLIPGISLAMFAMFAVAASAADFPLPTGNPGLGTGNPAPVAMTQVLPEEQAFALQAVPQADGSLVLMWEMPERYYLYRKSLAISTPDGRVLTPELPAATTITDEFFGATAVWFDKLLVSIPPEQLAAQPGTRLELLLTYQGCAQDLYCYPPVQKAVAVTLPE